MTAVEILSHPEWFDTTSQHCMHPLKDNAYVKLPSYTALFNSLWYWSMVWYFWLLAL